MKRLLLALALLCAPAGLARDDPPSETRTTYLGFGMCQSQVFYLNPDTGAYDDPGPKQVFRCTGPPPAPTKGSGQSNGGRFRHPDGVSSGFAPPERVMSSNPLSMNVTPSSGSPPPSYDQTIFPP